MQHIFKYKNINVCHIYKMKSYKLMIKFQKLYNFLIRSCKFDKKIFYFVNDKF